MYRDNCRRVIKAHQGRQGKGICIHKHCENTEKTTSEPELTQSSCRVEKGEHRSQRAMAPPKFGAPAVAA
jgi:hypothetical protein